LAQDLNLAHISVGDLLRAERENGLPEIWELIKTHMREGTIVPTEITMGILKTAISRQMKCGYKQFLVDGFPRHVKQAMLFEKEVMDLLSFPVFKSPA